MKYFGPDIDLNVLQHELAGEDLYLAHAPVDELKGNDVIDDSLYSEYANFTEMPAEEDGIDSEQLDESFWTGRSPTK